MNATCHQENLHNVNDFYVIMKPFRLRWKHTSLTHFLFVWLNVEISVMYPGKAEICGKQLMKWCGTAEEVICLNVFEIKVENVFFPSHPGISGTMNAPDEVRYELISLCLCLFSGGRGASGASGAEEDEEDEEASSCLRACRTDYSLIAVDVKADEVITWPARCGRARPRGKVNPPCVRGSSHSL